MVQQTLHNRNPDHAGAYPQQIPLPCVNPDIAEGRRQVSKSDILCGRSALSGPGMRGASRPGRLNN